MALPVMLDLETLGTKPGSAVLSIGAVEFDPSTYELGREFYVVIDKESSLDYGLTVDPETVAWWEKQDPAARTVLTEKGVPVEEALRQFSEFMSPNSSETLWGNGSDFDNVLLKAVYDNAGVTVPWSYWNNRCYRTMKNMFKQCKLRRTGTHHNALDDAKSQATHLLSIYSVIRGDA